MDRVSLAARQSVEAVAGVHLTQLATTESVSVQHFRIEAGATVPEHCHEHEQVGWIESGRAVFQVDGSTIEVSGGDSYAIPGGEPHGVEVRGADPLVGVDIFHPPRPAPEWGE